LKTRKAKPSAKVKKAVRIRKRPTSAVSVRNLNDPLHQPLQIPGAIIFTDGIAQLPVFPVPAGKRFVIEYVSARVRLKPGQILDQFEIWTSGGVFLPHYMIATPQGNTGVSLVSQPVRFYADPGTMVSMFVRSTIQKVVGDGNLSLAGYLVDVA
jgi:hypothetical protein